MASVLQSRCYLVSGDLGILGRTRQNDGRAWASVIVYLCPFPEELANGYDTWIIHTDKESF
jgi:hypothetical protein